MKKIYLVLLSIFILGLFLRMFWIGSIPPGVTGDEVQQGYTAYSILKTGKDEWGDFLPIYPRGFGDYKPPLYVYLTIPFIAVFGLNIESVRLPSAVLGSLSIILIFLITRKLFNNDRIALFSSLFLSIAPWHILNSRIAWESNIGSFFVLLGLWVFLKGLRNYVWFYLSAFSFGLTLFTYHSFKIFTPLFLLGLIFLFRKEVFKLKTKYLITAGFIFGFFILLTLYGSMFAGTGRRAADAAIYNPENITPLRNIQIEDKLPQPLGRVINNKINYISSQFLSNYLGYFSTTFYFSPHRSDGTLFNMSGQWLVYKWVAILFLLGIVLMIRRFNRPFAVLALILFIAPIPASLTREYMHLQRVQIMLFTIPLLAAVGLDFLLDNIRNKSLLLSAYLFIVLLITGSVIYQFDQFLFHTFNKNLGGLQYGYKEAIEYVENNKHKYNQILFTKNHSEPQAFVAFYTKMDPIIFQKNSQNWKGFEEKGFKYLDAMDYKLEKYYFKNIDFGKDSQGKDILIVTTPDQISVDAEPVKVINSNTSKPAFLIVDTNKL